MNLESVRAGHETFDHLISFFPLSHDRGVDAPAARRSLRVAVTVIFLVSIYTMCVHSHGSAQMHSLSRHWH